MQVGVRYTGPTSETIEKKTLMSEFDGTFILTPRTVATWGDRSTVILGSIGDISRNIFEAPFSGSLRYILHERVWANLYNVYSAKELFPRERDYFSADLIFDRGFINISKDCLFPLF